MVIHRVDHDSHHLPLSGADLLAHIFRQAAGAGLHYITFPKKYRWVAWFRNSRERRRITKRGRLILPWKGTEDFVKELMNEVRVIEKDKYGFEHQKWKKLGPNDWLDCLKYGLAVWSISFPALLEAGLIQSETTGSAA